MSGATATFVAAGTCTIQATQTGNSTYAAATAVSQSFTVNASMQSQTITFSNPGTQTVGTPLTLSATATSGLVVSFTSQTASICTVSGTAATFVAAGTCTIQATQAGNSTYAAATAVSQSFAVNGAAQTISFSTPATQTVGAPLTLSATASSGLTVSFASQTTSICTVSGTVATFIAAGNCTIQATQAGNSTYAAATAVSRSFTVNAASLQSQTITFSNPGTQTVGTPLTLSATASSGLTVSFASQTTSICTVSGTVATFIAAGNCTIQATQAGNSTYAAATAVSQSFTVQVAATPSIGNIPMFTNPSAPLTSTLTNSVITQASAGNVGIGTTTPSAPLQVVGPIQANEYDFSSGGTFTIPCGNNRNGQSYSCTIPNNGLTWQNYIYVPQPFAALSGQYGIDFLTNGTQSMTITSSGNVGIGTTSPGAALEVNGTGIKLTANSGGSMTYADGSVQTTAWNGVLNGGDYAEDMRATGKKEKYGPGDVLVLAQGDNTDVQKSAEPYSTMVAGIYATKPGVVGRREEVAKSADNIPMAMVGVVPTKVSAENGPIRKGDLLVTASMSGYAMKGTDRNRMLGAVLGKAMGSLDSGTGVIEVLVTLQ